MKTPRERYHNDIIFKGLVDMMVVNINQCNYTPSEMREAALLASIIYEEITIRPAMFLPNKKLETALEVLEAWKDKAA